MIDGNTLLTNVSSKHGAPMGRRKIVDNPGATVQLFRVRMVDGDYDCGGAYWGGGTPIYAAIGEGFQYFMRADSLDQAKLNLLEEFPALIVESSGFDDFLHGYIASALWITTDDNEDPLDANYEPSDISPELMAEMIEDCQKFLEENGQYLTAENYRAEDITDNPMDRAGHDFWLTRCGSGINFNDNWSRSVSEILNNASHKFGESWLYVGDDGKIYS